LVATAITVFQLVPANLGAGQKLVPFVGCASDGQAGFLEAPAGEEKTADTTALSVGEIAYYQSSVAPGVFAPRGWHCHGWYGSGGGTLLVTPEAPGTRPSSVWPETSGQAVEVSFDGEGGSGRYQAATYALLFFPKPAVKFIQSVNAILDVKISQKSLAPFANDSLRILSDDIAEFVTPSNKSGIGTQGFLLPSREPINGIAFLDQYKPDDMNFVTVRIRLNAADSRFRTALLRLNSECIREKRGCSSR
jgi:hypothetical protein